MSNLNLYLELSAVVLNLAYLYFLIKEKIICWFFGISASLLSIFLFYRSGLYSEAILFVYYVLIGIYGYILWRRNEQHKDKLKIQVVSFEKHVYFITLGIGLAFLTGWYFNTYTAASAAYLDAFTTVFSFIASYLQARKILGNWIFWIIINGTTLILYLKKDLYYYTGLTVIYLIFSVVGYMAWRRQFKLEKLA